MSQPIKIKMRLAQKKNARVGIVLYFCGDLSVTDAKIFARVMIIDSFSLDIQYWTSASRR